jgi:hypothetical protein
MPQRMPFFHDVPAHRYTVTLDGVQYEVRLVYRARTASWYLDLRDEQGVELVLGRRLSPGSSPVGGVITNGPPGKLVAFGADPYDRDEVELWYFTEAELAAEPGEEAERLPIEIAT